MEQVLITPAMGKRLIAKALVKDERVQKNLNKGTIVIIAGTTNGYLAEELLSVIQDSNDFNKHHFFRGIVLPPTGRVDINGRMKNQQKFIGDIVIRNGRWLKGKTIFDVSHELKEGDIIFKGANALNISDHMAAVYIGHPHGGTIMSCLEANLGRRVELVIPVGLEKNIQTNLFELSIKLNKPGNTGPRLLPIPGEIYTEIDAIYNLFKVKTIPIASGGVSGAEGSIWLGLNGKKSDLDHALQFINKISKEPPFKI